jgi:NAD-dependent SIR2 family protein deacetylase
MNTTQLAERIQQCKFLLVACGAGFSADSGLPVYADVANIPTYKELDLKYHDLARPSTMLDGEHQSDAELFFGFWGGCTNLYRETLSHEGYSIVKRWRDELDSQCTLEFKQFQVTFLKNNYGVEYVPLPHFLTH